MVAVGKWICGECGVDWPERDQQPQHTAECDPWMRHRFPDDPEAVRSEQLEREHRQGSLFDADTIEETAAVRRRRRFER